MEYAQKVAYRHAIRKLITGSISGADNASGRSYSNSLKLLLSMDSTVLIARNNRPTRQRCLVISVSLQVRRLELNTFVTGMNLGEGVDITNKRLVSFSKRHRFALSFRKSLVIADTRLTASPIGQTAKTLEL